MLNIPTNIITTVIFSGVLPTFIWLFFWLREDRVQPEPRGLLTLTFVAGGLSVLVILPIEHFVEVLGFQDTQRIFLFAATEEIIKYLVVALINFNSSYLDEPIDYAIYLITGSLGFAMVENVLFLTNPALQNNISFIVETGMLRFMGASVLHAVLAATLGIILGFVFYKKKSTRNTFLFIGLAVVTILHTIFNYFIIKYVEIDGLLTLGILWIFTIIIIALFEKVRKVTH